MQLSFETEGVTLVDSLKFGSEEIVLDLNNFHGEFSADLAQVHCSDLKIINCQSDYIEPFLAPFMCVERLVCFGPKLFNFSNQSFTHLKNLKELIFECEFGKNDVLRLPPSYNLGLTNLEAIRYFLFGSRINLLEFMQFVSKYPGVKLWEINCEDLQYEFTQSLRKSINSLP